MTNNNSKGFCIFYDWLKVFEMLGKEDVADLVLAIGRYYTEGADILEGVSDSTKPLATLIAQQIERARESKAAKTTFVRTGTKNKTKTKAKTKTEAETDTNTETKAKTKTEAETNTETETKTKTEAETKNINRLKRVENERKRLICFNFICLFLLSIVPMSPLF